MAVLGKLKVAPNQRLDLPDLVAFDAYSAGDWKGFLETMVGSKPYVIKGFEVYQPNTLIGNPANSVDVILASASLWWSSGEEGSFFVSLPGAANKSVTLITDATNYIEMTLTLSSRAQDARALWDPGANGGAGGEFTQVVDTENFLDAEVTRNNTGFSEDKIPIAKIVVNSSNNVVSVTDSRPLLFRLGTGGNSPDPLNSYNWQDDPEDYGRQDTPTTMTSPSDPNVFQGADKNIRSFKEWMDAVMSRIKELDGNAKWFQASGGTGGGALSLTHLFQDSQAGHSVLPDRKVTLTWSKANDGKFRSENAVGYSAPVRWGLTLGQLRWQLGGTFTSASNREYSDFTFEVSVADGENVYLALQRDAAINGDPIVHFENQSGVTGFCSALGAGCFIGVACGDYIRKESGSVYQYYRVAELRVNSGTSFTNGTVEGTVADATVQYLLLETHDGPIGTSDEPFRYYRKAYSQDDLIVSNVGALDTSKYWLGRRFGDMFFLRDYGDMQPGEETEVIDDHSSKVAGDGVSDLVLEHAYDSVYDAADGYKLKSDGLTTLLTVRRRLSDNTVGTPSNVDNSGALLQYTIDAPIGLMNDNDGLWIRLGTTSGALSSGDVTDVSTDNVWQVLDSASTPLRTYDNSNVFLIARKFTSNGIPYLAFTDGRALAGDGEWVNQHLAVQGDFYLKQFNQWSIPFISTTGGKFAQNNPEFFWNDGAGPDSLGQLGVRNLRVGKSSLADVIDQAVARDLNFLTNLGAHTIKFGNAASTVHILGDLLVDGNTTSINTSVLQVDDKLISVGIGSILDGAYGAGLEAADNTLNATQIDSTSGQAYLDITYSAPHGYAEGDVVGTDSNVACGGITAGQISSTYTVVASGSTVGDAEVISSTVLRVWTLGTATSTASVSLTPPSVQVRTYTAPWSIRISDSSGAYTSGVTSWAFRVKGVSTAPTLTPVQDYGTVPTAHSANMSATRIPFVDNDNSGPSGADSTLNFTSDFTWTDASKMLIVMGSVGVGNNDSGQVLAQRLVLGTTADTTSSGGMSFGSDTPVYRSDVNTLKMTGSMIVGATDTAALGRLHVDQVSSSSTPAALFACSDFSNTSGLVRVTNFGTGPTIYTADQVSPTDLAESLWFKTGSSLDLDSGNVMVQTGDASGTASSGSITLSTGVAVDVTGLYSGNIFISTGNGTSGSGGVYVAAGQSTGSAGVGGGVNVNAGQASGANSSGGALAFVAGDSSGSGGLGGSVNIQAGSSTDSSAPGLGGSVSIIAGSSAGSFGAAGAININAGNATNTSGSGGAISVIAGNASDGSGIAGYISLSSGNAAGASTAGDISLVAGNSVDGFAGNLFISAGTATGSGADGQVTINGLMLINASNNKYVGIGNSSPSALLTLADGSTTDAAHGILFGSGLSNLYRSGTDTLKTDGNLEISGSQVFGGGVRFAYGTASLSRTVDATDCIIPIDSSSAGSTSTASNATGTIPQVGLDTSHIRIAQTFLATQSGNITSVTLKLTRFANPTSAIVLELRTLSGSQPSTTVLCTSDPDTTYTSIPSDGVTTGDVTFTFVGGAAITSGMSYAIVLRGDTGAVSPGQVGVAGATPSVYADGEMYHSDDGTTWNLTNGGADAVFDVQVQLGSEVILPASTSTEKGRLLIVKDVGGVCSNAGKNITIKPNGSDTIDGAGSLVMDEDRSSYTLVANGAGGWDIV